MSYKRIIYSSFTTKAGMLLGTQSCKRTLSYSLQCHTHNMHLTSHILNDERLFIFHALDRKWLNHFSFLPTVMHCIFVQIPISELQTCDTLSNWGNNVHTCSHTKHKTNDLSYLKAVDINNTKLTIMYFYFSKNA